MSRLKFEADVCQLVIFLAMLTTVSCHAEAPRLLVISLGGFRHDYLGHYNLPSLTKFYKEGVKAEWLQSAFMTDCSINHYSIATGLFPESHGVTVGDTYGRDARQHLCGSKDGHAKENKYAGEPIWVTNKKRAKSVSELRKHGVINWPHADAQPDRSDFTVDATLRQKFTTVASWLSGHQSINLGLLYHDEPDRTGHSSGWNSTEMNITMGAIDKDFGDFVSALEAKEMLDEINILVVSDHGMANADGTPPIYLSDCLQDPTEYTLEQSGPVVSIWPRNTDAALAAITTNVSSMGSCRRLAIYNRTTIPAAYHYRSMPTNNIAPLILESPQGVPVYATSDSGNVAPKGMHGWNNAWDPMKAIFLARGPAFKRGHVVKGFENVHLYELMCKLLDLTPAPNNGSLAAVQELLAEHAVATEYHTTIFTEFFVVIGAAAVAGVFIVGACKLQQSFIRHGVGGRRLVGLPGVSSTTDSRRLLPHSNKQPLLGGAAHDSSDEESL